MSRKEENIKVLKQENDIKRWKWIVWTLLAMTLFVILAVTAALQKPVVKRERELKVTILEAVWEEVEPFDKKNVTVEIQFRDVDAAKQYDRVYAKIKAWNDTEEMTYIYYVEYGLRNKRWVLETFELVDCNKRSLKNNNNCNLVRNCDIVRSDKERVTTRGLSSYKYYI